LAVAHCFTAWLHQCRREGRAAQEQAEALIALSTEQDFAYWLMAGALLRGWALAQQGQTEEGIAVLSQGLNAGQTIAAALGRAWALTLLAEVYGKTGHFEGSSAALGMALQIGDNTGERFYAAETYRLKGELLQKAAGGQQTTGPNPQTEAETCFRQAIDLAHHQGAKSLELRAAVSLSRVLKGQGKTQEAQKLLKGVYARFTEGFTTADLREARQLLEEMP